MSRNYDLTGIAPQNVWKYFYEISQIPRNSGDKQRITDYLMDFCKKHGLKAHRDEAMNVVALVPATPGYEDLTSVTRCRAFPRQKFCTFQQEAVLYDME